MRFNRALVILDHSIVMNCALGLLQVKQWDTETTACVDTFSGSRAWYCIAAAPADQQLVAFGGADKALHLWDPRAQHTEKQVC